MKTLRRHGAPCHYLPEELTTNILERLPAKSLVHCMSVQKSWYHLIKSPHFVSSHFNYQKTHHKYLLLESDDDQAVPLTLRAADKPRKRCSLLAYHPDLPDCPWYGVSNGLICLASMVKEEIPYNGKVWLWNPAIRKLKTLPDPPRSSIPGFDKCVRLAFGFCPKVNDFKVVKIIINYSSQGNRMAVADVYSLTTNSWKTINDLIFTQRFGNNDWVFLDSAAYFNGLTVEKENIIVCYNTDQDIMRVISFPEICSARDYSLQLYGKSVALFIKSSPKNFNMWVLNEGWEMRISLNLDDIPSTGHWHYWQVVGMRSNAEVLLLNDSVHGHALVSFNVEKNMIKWFGWVTQASRIGIFTECLFMINN